MSRGARVGLVAVALLLAACEDDAPPARRVAPELHTAADSAAYDAAILGTEISRLLDLAADYRGSHRGRVPRRLRDMAVDSLTRDLARAISTGSGGTRVTVSFRRPAGRQYASCAGDLAVLESASLGDGGYTLTCTTPSGELRTVQAGGVPE